MLKRELSPSELPQFCEELVSGFTTKQILLLQGSVGVGKTHFVKALLESLGFSGAHSPSYSLINEYQGRRFKKIFHIDLYRLEDEDDMESTGFWDLFEEESALILIEWPEKMNLSELPRDWSQFTLSLSNSASEETRLYQWSGS
ncbi:MAG: tRNA (adenosine(37)-N6)-threonylcarbamoyltransferase complex ATPase subunit type 1 TsaE [Pseudomonadota bacterium]